MFDANDKQINDFIAAPLNKVIESLAALEKDEDRPLLSIQLQNGRELVGYLTGLIYEKENATALFYMPNRDNTLAGSKLAYILCHSIQAIEIHKPLDYLNSFQVGLFRKTPPKAPSKLELARKVKELGETFSSKNKVSLAVELNNLSDENALRGVEASLNYIFSSLTSIAQDKLGLESLKKVKELKISYDENMSALLKGESILLAVNSFCTQKEILSAIEAVL